MGGDILSETKDDDGGVTSCLQRVVIDSFWGPFTYIYLIKSFEDERGEIISLILEMSELHLQEVK